MISKWDIFWEFLHGLWIIAIYILILLAMWSKDWAEATVWLAWLIYDRIAKPEAT
jgi:hypothetical protein